MQILEGKNLSIQILEKLKKQIAHDNLNIKLSIILVGEDPASIKYTSLKQQKGQSIGITVDIHRFSADTSARELINFIKNQNQDESVTGIMVQLPLPRNIDQALVVNSIDPKKDVDGLTATNLGRLFQKQATIISATPKGIMALLDNYSVSLSGKNAVIIGRSFYIGLPLTALLLNRDVTPVICHTKTKDLQSIVKNADIIMTAVGKGKYITKDWVKPGSIIVDIAGDVDFDDLADKTSFITPIIGGVGPMTVASLLANTVKIAYENSTL